MSAPQTTEDLAPALEGWLRKHMAGGEALKVLEMSRPRGGFSAHTLLVKIAMPDRGPGREHEWVIRLERSGREIFLDTDIARQGRMMRALGEHGIPVPEVLAVEPDRTLLGGQFLVMDRIVGQSLPQHPSYQVAGLLHDLAPERRYSMWKEAVATIGRINAIGWTKGFEFLNKTRYGPPGLEQYLAWLSAWKTEATRGEPHRVIDAAMAYLRAKPPATEHVDVLWGDSNPGNFLFDADGHVLAAHDFEASALGPGEIDLGWWFFLDELLSLGAPRLQGLPERAAQIAIYEAAIGRAVGDVGYYELLAGVRICLVVVRSAQLLIGEGRLPPSSRAGSENPIVDLLATKLGMESRGSIEDYMQFVTVMNQR